MGPLWKFAWGANGPPKTGEWEMCFNGGTLQILLGPLEIQMVEAPEPRQKMSTESLDIKVFQQLTDNFEWNNIFLVNMKSFQWQ